MDALATIEQYGWLKVIHKCGWELVLDYGDRQGCIFLPYRTVKKYMDQQQPEQLMLFILREEMKLHKLLNGLDILDRMEAVS